MKFNKEVLVGILVTLIICTVIAAITGTYGLIFIGISFVVVIISINLISKKSVAAKTSAVILNTDLIYKILMPQKYKKELKSLQEKENHDNH